MKAVRIHQHGGPEQLLYEDAPHPGKPAYGEVLVRLNACSLNYRDIEGRMGKRGTSRLMMPLPQILGADGSGVVEEVGEGVGGLKQGDGVLLTHTIGCGHCYWCLSGKDHYCDSREQLGIHRPGTYAQYIKVPRSNVIPKPHNLTFEEASSLALVLLTSWPMIISKGRITASDEVLIHAAGSGIGSISIQIVKALGARVITTAGTAEKCRRALEIGADEAINYREKNSIDEVLRFTNGRGVDAVLDCVGGRTMADSIHALAMGGRLVTCASGSLEGDIVPISNSQARDKRAEIIFSALGSKGDLLDALELVEQGKVKPVIYQVLPLQDAATAHRLMEERQQFGKIVLQVP